MSQGPTFSVQEIPFSHRGSWFGISPVIAEQTYAEDLHLVSHQTGMHPVLRLQTRQHGQRVDPLITAEKIAVLTGGIPAARQRSIECGHFPPVEKPEAFAEALIEAFAAS